MPISSCLSSLRFPSELARAACTRTRRVANSIAMVPMVATVVVAIAATIAAPTLAITVFEPETGSEPRSNGDPEFGTEFGTEVGTEVGSKVGFKVGSNVGSKVGSKVGFEVGTEVVSEVGFEVGPKVGSGKSSERRSAVGSKHSSERRTTVDASVRPSAEAVATLADDITSLRSDGPQDAASRITRMLRDRPDPSTIADVIANRPSTELAADLPRGWSGRMAPLGGPRAGRVPYMLYVPRSLPAGDAPVPLLVHLHGGVGRATYPERAEDAGLGGRLWGPMSERMGMPIVLPLARAESEWWVERGEQAIAAVLRDCRRVLPIDDDRIIATGFSDGGTGCYYLAMHAPQSFAAFMPMNGQPEILTTRTATELHPRNMARSPMIAIGTRNDHLYPMSTVMPHLMPALNDGGSMRIISWESGGHQPTYFLALEPMIEAFLRTVRRPSIDSIRWRFAVPGAYGPVVVERLGGRNAETDQIMSVAPPPSMWVQLEPGGGTQVNTVIIGGLAHAIGVRPGDRILRLAGRATPDPASLVEAALRVRPGDAPTAVVERDGARRTLSGRWAAHRPRPLYRRSGRVGLAEARIMGGEMEVLTEGITRLRLEWPGPGQPPSSVRVNGSPRKVDWTPIEARELLETWAASGDAGQLRTHRSEPISVRR
ncbi:MAG: hypothetical protein AB8G96_02035 [Phycisphaerales bacterium]